MSQDFSSSTQPPPPTDRDTAFLPPSAPFIILPTTLPPSPLHSPRFYCPVTTFQHPQVTQISPSLLNNNDKLHPSGAQHSLPPGRVPLSLRKYAPTQTIHTLALSFFCCYFLPFFRLGLACFRLLHLGPSAMISCLIDKCECGGDQMAARMDSTP